MSRVWSSTPVNTNSTIWLPLMAGGALTMTVSGGVVSTGSAISHSYRVGRRALSIVNGPIASTSNLWLPTSSWRKVIGDSHSVHGMPSIEHWIIVSGTSDANVKVALFESLIRSGPSMIRAIGSIAEPCARAKMLKSVGSAHTRPDSGSLVRVMSFHSLPLKWTMRAGPSVKSVGSYGMHR